MLERETTRMPGEVGDAPSPSFYHMPNISRLQEELGKGDFSGTLPWVSFSTTNYAWAHVFDGQPSSGWVTMNWDPKVTQKMGFILKQNGADGIFVYPGPADNDVPIDYFMAHAQALIDGFVGGIDPGELVEICGDNLDNDGDGYWDEGCGGVV